MIKFEPSGIGYKDGAYFLSYDHIEASTKLILKDYNESILTNPQAIDYEDFLLNYLEVEDVTFLDIYSNPGEGQILGCTIFNRQALEIFNREQMCKSEVFLSSNTVVMDNCLLILFRRKSMKENKANTFQGTTITRRVKVN